MIFYYLYFYLVFYLMNKKDPLSKTLDKNILEEYRKFQENQDYIPSRYKNKPLPQLPSKQTSPKKKSPKKSLSPNYSHHKK